jgi:hypothetical protein
MKLSVTELGIELRRNAELLTNVNGDLDRMNPIKRGPPWHLDRVEARQRLLSSRDRLQDQLRALVLSN